MSGSFRHSSVRLDQGQWDRIGALARDRNVKPADIIREAVETWLGAVALLSQSQQRLARLAEFQHLALDVIIRQNHPEYRERILAETDKRLEIYHGA